MNRKMISTTAMRLMVTPFVVVGMVATSIVPAYAETGDTTPAQNATTTTIDPNALDQPAGGSLGNAPGNQKSTAGTAQTGVDVIASSDLISPTVAGHPFVSIVKVANIGNASAGLKGAVTFTLSDFPSYLSLKNVAPVLGAASKDGDFGWRCSGAVCTLVTKKKGAIVNGSLIAGQSVRAYVTFNVAAGANVPVMPADLLDNAKKLAKAGDAVGAKALIDSQPHVNVTAQAPADVNADNNMGTIQLFGASELPVVSTYLDNVVPATVYPGGTFSFKLRVLPTGSENRAKGYSVSNVLPEGLALTNVSGAGTGWTCADGLKTCTNDSGALAIGQFSPELVVTGTVAATQKVSDTAISWTVDTHTTLAVGNDPVEGSGVLSLTVVEAPKPDVAIRLTTHGGKASVMAPNSVQIDANIRASRATAEDVAIRFTIPKGLSFKGLADGMEGWKCDAAVVAGAKDKAGQEFYDCVKPQLEADSPEVLSINVSADITAKAGTVALFGAISAKNEDPKFTAGNKVSVSLVVQPLPAPLPAVVLSRPNEKGATEAVVDGSATEVLIGKPNTYAIEVRNLGSKEIKTGQVVRVEQFVQSNVSFTGDAFAGATDYSKDINTVEIAAGKPGQWQCVTGQGIQPAVNNADVVDVQKELNGTDTSVAATNVSAKKAVAGPVVRCEITLASAVPSDKATPVLNMTPVMASNAKEEKPEWPIFASIPAIAASPISRYGMTVSIKEYRAQLDPYFIIPAGPRPGGNAVATLSLKNSGDAPAANQVVVIPSIKNGAILSVSGDTWDCATLGGGLSSGFTLCSRAEVLKSGAETPKISIKYAARAAASAKLSFSAVSLVDTPRKKSFSTMSSVPVELRPALAFDIKGNANIVDEQVNAKGKRVPTSILFSAVGNAEGSQFTWTQLCVQQSELTANGGTCDELAPVAEWKAGKPSTGPTAQFLAPKVSAKTTLVFEATATENGATTTARYSVTVEPTPTISNPTPRVGSGSSVLGRVAGRSQSVGVFAAATPPTSGTGDTTSGLSNDPATVSVNGNIYGDRNVTVAVGGRVSLTAAASGVGAISYAWAQASGSVANVLSAATGVATDSVSFTAPNANATITLRVTATDANGTKGSDVITVVVGSGAAITSSVAITEGEGPIHVDSSASLTLHAVGAGTGAISYVWTQLSGPTQSLTGATSANVTLAASNATGSVVMQVQATDANSVKTTTTVQLRLAPMTVPTPLCDFVSAVSTSTLSKVQSELTTLGITGLNLNQFSVSSATCTETSTVAFTNAGFSISSFLTVSEATGVISATGLRINSGRFTGPASWGSPVFIIKAGTAGLFVPFSRTSATVGPFEGTVSMSSMPFITMPAGWTMGASLTFGIDEVGTKHLSFSATGTGPNNGSASVVGAVATDGTFSLDATVNNAVQLFGADVTFAGKITGGGNGSTPTASLSGSINGTITIASGITMNSIAVARDEDGVITGSAAVQIGSGDAALALNADLNYVDAKNYSFSLTAAASGATWTPAKGFSIPLKTASGSVAVVDGDTTVDATVTGNNSTPFSGVAVNSPSITAKGSCPAGKSCTVTVSLTADAVATMGSTSVTGQLKGDYDSAAKTASFKATMGSVPVVAGLALDSASLEISSTGVGTASVATTATLSGSMKVFDKTVTASAALSKDGLTLTAALPEISPFGANGPTFKPGQFSWSSGAINITPKVPSIPSLGAVSLKPKVPRLDLALAIPSQLADFAGSTVATVGDISFGGDVDFSTGKINFAADMKNATATVAGSISRESTGAGYLYALTGTVLKPIALTSSVSLRTFTFALGNKTAGGPLALTGSAGIDVSLPNGTVLDVNGSVAYNSSTDYTVTLSTGATSTSISSSGGSALPLGTMTGTIKKDATQLVMTLDVASVGTWTPISGLNVTNVKGNAAFTCKTGDACATTFNVTGTIALDINVSGLSTAQLSGSLDATGFTFKATFGDLVMSKEMKIVAPSITVTLPKTGANTSASGTLAGTLSLFGVNASAAVAFSSAGALFTADLPAFTLPGTDLGYNGGQFAWLMKAPTTLSWTPKVPKLTVPAVNLSVGAPQFALSMVVPDSLKQMSSTAANLPDVAVSGSYTPATGAYSFNASVANDAFSLAGSFSRDSNTANTKYTVTASVKQPLSFISGLTLSSFNLKITNQTAAGTVAITGDGAVKIDAPNAPINLNFSLAYASATDYSFSLATSSGSWSPFPGLTIPLSGLSGSFARKGTTKTAAVNFAATDNWSPFTGLTIGKRGASITANCTVGSACALAFNMTGDVTANLGSGNSAAATLKGTFTNTSADISATFADTPIFAGATLKAPTLAMSYTSANGLAASMSGGANILGANVTMGATFSAQGVLLAAGFADWKPLGDSGPTLSNAEITYATYTATNISIPGAPALGKISLTANAPSLIAGISVPQWLKDFVKQPDLNVVPVTIPLTDLAGGKIPTLRIMLPTPSNWYLYNTSSGSMRFTGVGFEIAGSPKPSMSLIGTADIKTSPSAAAVPLELRGTIGATSMSIALSLGTDMQGNVVPWNNAFGISGLTLTQAALQMGITFQAPIPLPSLGIAATASLPAEWRSQMGMENGVAVKIAANIDVQSPCFAFQAGTLGADNKTITNGTAKVINVAGGALTATFMNLTIAPVGCQIGNIKFDPGVSANFDGTVLGTPVSVAAKIGTSPFSLEASVAVGAFNAGPVKVDQTTIGIKISPAESYVSFAGGVTVGSTRVSVAGKTGYNTTDGPYLTMKGNVDNLVIVPSFLEIKTASLDLDIRSKSGYARVIANGDFTFLGSPSKVALDLTMQNYELQKANASITTQRTIAAVTINGTFNLAYTKGSAPSLAFDATASAAGFNLGRATGVVNSNQVSITATVSISSVFSAQVTGQVVWSAAPGITVGDRNGNQVQAQTGDFRIAATNVVINLGGFAASGNVAVGKIGSVGYADFSASFAIGAGDVGGQVNVAGSFSTDGNFSFNGSGNLNLVGFTANATVAGYKTGANWGFTVNTTMSVMGAVNVAFGGNVYKNGTATRFTLNGSASLGSAGVAGASGAFRISNEPGQAGMYIAISVNFAGINGSGSLVTYADGTFDGTINVGLNWPGVSAAGTMRIANQAWTCPKWWSCANRRVGTYMTLDSWINLAGAVFRLNGNVNSDGSFRFDASAGPWNWSTGFSLGVLDFRFGAGFQSTVTVTSWSPYVSVQASGYGYMDNRWWGCSWRGGRWNKHLECGWDDWYRAATVGLGFNTNPGNIWINLGGYQFGLR